jgi:hypothetical protein
LAAALIERLHETRFYVYDCSGEQHLILFVLGKVLMEGMWLERRSAPGSTHLLSIPAGVIGYCYSVISFALHLDWFFSFHFPPLFSYLKFPSVDDIHSVMSVKCSSFLLIRFFMVVILQYLQARTLWVDFIVPGLEKLGVCFWVIR